MRKREGALAPESALRGDHSCTLPAANWSLSSCPIHLHFLPITEHYLCSQLGMGLNPFWLSWCYSLQISNEEGEGRVREQKTKNKKKEGKVDRKEAAERNSGEKKLPITPHTHTHTLHKQEAVDELVTSRERRLEKWKGSIIGIIIQVLVCQRLQSH